MPETVRVTTHHADGTSETARLQPGGRAQARLQDRIGPYRDGVAAPTAPDTEPIDAFAAPPRPFWDDRPDPWWRTRFADARVRSALLVLGALVFGLAWFLWDTGPGAGSMAAGAAAAKPAATPSTGATGSGSKSAASSATPSGSAVDGRVTVHVAGAVKRPGVISLRTGARVVDAIQAAGGADAAADLTHINLAAPVSDGAQVLVVHNGEAGGSTVAPAGATRSGASSAPVNLNSASVAELDALPGIGPTRAQDIVREREAHGPFRTVEDLQRVKGLGAARIAELRERVTT